MSTEVPSHKKEYIQRLGWVSISRDSNGKEVIDQDAACRIRELNAKIAALTKQIERLEALYRAEALHGTHDPALRAAVERQIANAKK